MKIQRMRGEKARIEHATIFFPSAQATSHAPFFNWRHGCWWVSDISRQ
jgi:hypothetical protein